MNEQDDRPTVPEEHVARQIGFAERWLVRAKQEVAAGHVARSGLTLLLAEAEVHRAREQTLPAREAVLPRPSTTASLGGVGILVVLLLAISLAFPRGEMPAGLSSVPSVMRLDPVGSTLALIPAIAMAAEPATPAPPPLLSAVPPVARAWRPPTRPVLRSAVKVRAQRPTTNVPVAPALVSDGDLVDLVLAAERSLRAERR